MGKKKQIHNKIAIVASDFNKEITDGLLNGALKVLRANGYEEKKISIFRCPGAFEIPYTAKKICRSKKYSAVICLGAVIKGETAHFEYISQAASQGIMELTLQSEIPVAFGILTCYTEQQAIERSGEIPDNKGAEAANAVLQMLQQKI